MLGDFVFPMTGYVGIGVYTSNWDHLRSTDAEGAHRRGVERFCRDFFLVSENGGLGGGFLNIFYFHPYLGK